MSSSLTYDSLFILMPILILKLTNFLYEIKKNLLIEIAGITNCFRNETEDKSDPTGTKPSNYIDN